MMSSTTRSTAAALSARRAAAAFERNWVAQAHRILLPDAAPLLHFVRQLDVLTWWIAEVDENRTTVE